MTLIAKRKLTVQEDDLVTHFKATFEGQVRRGVFVGGVRVTHSSGHEGRNEFAGGDERKKHEAYHHTFADNQRGKVGYGIFWRARDREGQLH